MRESRSVCEGKGGREGGKIQGGTGSPSAPKHRQFIALHSRSSVANSARTLVPATYATVQRSAAVPYIPTRATRCKAAPLAHNRRSFYCELR